MKKLFKGLYLIFACLLLAIIFAFNESFSATAERYYVGDVNGTKLASGNIVYGGVNGSLHGTGFRIIINGIFVDGVIDRNSGLVLPYVNNESVNWTVTTSDIGNDEYITIESEYDNYELFLTCDSTNFKTTGKAKCGISLDSKEKVNLMDDSILNYDIVLKGFAFSLKSLNNKVKIENYKSDKEYDIVEKANIDDPLYVYGEDFSLVFQGAGIALDANYPGKLIGVFDAVYTGSLSEIENIDSTDNILQLSNIMFNNSIKDYYGNLKSFISIRDNVETVLMVNQENDSNDSNEIVEEKTIQEITKNPDTGIFNYLLLLIPVGILVAIYFVIKYKKKVFKN
jgi:hypothetical protein